MNQENYGPLPILSQFSGMPWAGDSEGTHALSRKLRGIAVYGYSEPENQATSRRSCGFQGTKLVAFRGAGFMRRQRARNSDSVITG